MRPQSRVNTAQKPQSIGCDEWSATFRLSCRQITPFGVPPMRNNKHFLCIGDNSALPHQAPFFVFWLSSNVRHCLVSLLVTFVLFCDTRNGEQCRNVFLLLLCCPFARRGSSVGAETSSEYCFLLPSACTSNSCVQYALGYRR